MQTIRIQSIGMMLAAIILAPALTAQQSSSAADDEEKVLALQNQMPEMDSETYVYLHQVVELDLQNATLEEALTAIAEQADLKLMYRKALLPEDKKVSYNNSSKTVYDALWELLDETGIQFAISQNRQLVLLKMQDVERVEETEMQETVSGQVMDAQTGEPLPGVNILLQGSESGTSTNIDGEFELNVPDLTGTLVFSFIGYLNQEVPINGNTNINVSLTSTAILGEELIVVGYGTQRRDDVTGSIKQVSGRDIEAQPVVQTSGALMGKVPGVQVIQNSGQPGENQATIRIRGTGTLGNSNPLVLIDGVQGSLDDVASTDIENITVLKDASAASVYGSRAANGVILVTTKRGLEEGVQVNYRGFAGIQEATNQPQFTDAGTHMRLENMGAVGLGNQPIWSEGFISDWEANHQTDSDNFPNTDWVGDLFSETGYQQRHHLDVLGGTESIRYRGSLSFDEEVSEIPNFNFQRYAARFNTDVIVSEKLSFVFDANVQRKNQLQATPGLNLITKQAYRIPAVYPGQFTHGGWGIGWNTDNPIAYANDAGLDRRETYTIRGRIAASFQPIDNLEFNVMYAPEYETFTRRAMNKLFEITSPESADDIIAVTNRIGRNDLRQELDNNFSNNLNITSEYLVNLGGHSVRTMGGFEYIDFRQDFFHAYRDDFPLQDFEQLDAGSPANMQNSGSATEWAIASLFGRVNYDYQNRYLLQANIRYDGSSRFSEGNRWGIFPSFSVGWMISEESFMNNIDFINSLKIRGSWGQLGNQQIGNYPFASTINLNRPFLFGGNTVTGGAQLDLSNEDISWETTTSTNIGLDAAFLEDRVFLNFDYFWRETDDILLQLPVPRIIGLGAPFQNAGVVENEGWELELGYSGFAGRDFSYNVSLNVSDVNNKVTDLRGAGPFISGNTIIREGDPINSIWGFESDGLFQSQTEIDEHATQTGNVSPGDIRFIDQNGDGVINADDQVIIGDPFPKLNFGINLSANYKNFDLSAFIQGVGSREVFLQSDAVWAMHNAGKIRQWQADDFWTPDNPNAFTPRLTPTTDHNNFRTSDHWVFDASYLRLRNLQIGYTLPLSLTERFQIRSARIFFLGQNLFTLTRSFPDSRGMPPGIDPNVPNGSGGGFFPVSRLFSAGIDLNF